MSVNSYKSLEEGIYHRTFYDKVFCNTKVDRFIDSTVVLISFLFVSGTFVYLIIEGIKQRILYLFIAICIIAYMYCEIKLIRYYRKGELEPKFKKLILGIGMAIIIQCGISILAIRFKF